ncbi:hypothetical protein BJ085DRAFT_31740 [Dimargaris cristalligena]|uniref:Uncharacterized protein n=1 Tax=Dimargaris cristalligena TaxID=215637 RepID=A0A4V1J5N2_9FUNG|nr:hypothetical protein BJ085DRAFT_31740 [Dimargaris cristalligena]|eukprot:RKP39649.1 hypothetical protein BJ085DRAFT_31740 [Dimargaris cristalligena]
MSPSIPGISQSEMSDSEKNPVSPVVVVAVADSQHPVPSSREADEPVGNLPIPSQVEYTVSVKTEVPSPALPTSAPVVSSEPPAALSSPPPPPPPPPTSSADPPSAHQAPYPLPPKSAPTSPTEGTPLNISPRSSLFPHPPSPSLFVPSLPPQPTAASPLPDGYPIPSTAELIYRLRYFQRGVELYFNDLGLVEQLYNCNSDTSYLNLISPAHVRSLWMIIYFDAWVPNLQVQVVKDFNQGLDVGQRVLEAMQDGSEFKGKMSHYVVLATPDVMTGFNLLRLLYSPDFPELIEHPDLGPYDPPEEFEREREREDTPEYYGYWPGCPAPAPSGLYITLWFGDKL